MIHLLLQYYNDRNAARQAELNLCLARNLANPAVAGVHCLVEKPVRIPKTLTGNPKLQVVNIGAWLTYKIAFDYANRHLAGAAIGLANADIWLDPASPWGEIASMIDAKMVLCQTRHEWRKGIEPFIDPEAVRTGCMNWQDAWFWRSPIEVPDSDFELGLVGCDNAIAHRFSEAGFRPINQPRRFRIFHVDNVRRKTAEDTVLFHYNARKTKPKDRRPYDRGVYFVPDVEMVQKWDWMADLAGTGRAKRYIVGSIIANKLFAMQYPPDDMESPEGRAYAKRMRAAKAKKKSQAPR